MLTFPRALRKVLRSLPPRHQIVIGTNIRVWAHVAIINACVCYRLIVHTHRGDLVAGGGCLASTLWIASYGRRLVGVAMRAAGRRKW